MLDYNNKFGWIGEEVQSSPPFSYLELEAFNSEYILKPCDIIFEYPKQNKCPMISHPCRFKGYVYPVTGWEYSYSPTYTYISNLPPVENKHLTYLKLSHFDKENKLILQSFTNTTPVVLSGETEYVVKLVENILTLVRLLTQAKNKSDFMFAFTVFAQCRSDKSLTSSLLQHWGNIMNFFLEGEDTNYMGSMRDILNKYDSVKKLPIFTKLYRFLMYCIGTSLFEKLGLKFDFKRFTRLEEATIKKEYYLGTDFIHCMLDTILYFCEAGYQFMKTGRFDSFLHHETTYEKWIQESELLRIQAKSISNPEPHGFTVFDFLNRLDENINQGKSILKFMDKSDYCHIIIRRLLLDLENIRVECKTRKLAQQERKAPFAVLVHGGSSVAKSQFTKMLYYHYGKLFNLPIDDEYKYSRNAFDQYWTNFNSSQWCIQLDDVAYLHPESSQGCDPSLVEMLQVVNNVPYVPTQADIADKGKTPVNARFVIATTNTENLNAEKYFACPLAVQRRLPYIISIIPKDEYCRDEGSMIDPSKIPPSEQGLYPNLWNIIVKKVVPKDNTGVRRSTHMGQTAEAVVLNTFDDITDFLMWFNHVAQIAAGNQEKAMKCDKDMKSATLCKHLLPSSQCAECSLTEDVICIHGVSKLNCDTCMINIRGRIQQPQLQSGDEIVVYNTPWVTRMMEQIRQDRSDANDAEFDYRWLRGGWTIDCFSYPARTCMWAIYRRIQLLYSFPIQLMVWFYIQILELIKSSTYFSFIFRILFGEVLVISFFCMFLHDPQCREATIKFLGWRAFQAIRTPKCVILCAAIVSAVTLIKTSRYLIDLSTYMSSTTIDDNNVDKFVIVCNGCEECNHTTFDERVKEARAMKPGCKIISTDDIAKGKYRFRISNKTSISCLQGLTAERGEAPQPKGDKLENVWYKDSFECTTFDIPKPALSRVDWSLDKSTAFVARNCVSFKRRVRDGDNIIEKRGKGFCVCGQTYVFNNHCLPGESFELELIFHNAKDGISENFISLVTPSQITRLPEKDLVFVNMPSIPPRCDMRDWFALDSFAGRFDGTYVARSLQGDIQLNNFRATQKMLDFSFEDPSCSVSIKNNFWRGNTAHPTALGDCGSILLVKTAMGPLILGLHTLGGLMHFGCATSLTRETIDSVLGNKMIIHDNRPVLQVGEYKKELVQLHKKATTRYIEKGTMQVYGSLAGFRRKLKSRVTKTIMCNKAIEHGYSIKTGPPVMNSYKPWRKALLDLADPVTHMDLTLLKHCKECFLKDILDNVPAEDLAEVKVYDLNTAVNGKPGLAYVDKMPRNTSAGFPFNKSKKYFLEKVDPFDDFQHPVKITCEIEDDMDRMIKNYEKNIMNCPVFTGSLKDEPLPFSKIEDEATRVFCGAPMSWSILVRMYFLPIVRLVQKNRFLFESGPGTIAQSKEWDDIYEYLVQFGIDRIVAGDYRKFDKRMPAAVILEAFDLLISICRAAGYSDRDICVCLGIAYDTAFPTIDFNGELLRIFGSNPSGHPLTVIINGIANCLYVRYCYATNHPLRTCCDFKSNVALMTYGDDMIMGVNRRCTWLDHTKMQQVLASIGIGFTMADKTAPSIPFININEASFLKRTWRYEPELGLRVCPIDHDSINKMLTMCVASKTVSPELQGVAVLDTATREYFWYGKEIFEEKRKLFNKFIEELGLEPYLERNLPTWSQLVSEFNTNSNLRSNKSGPALPEPKVQNGCSAPNLIVA
jgi:hypothetical protein